MSRIKTWVLVAVALAFISTVTIFDPAYISDAFLSRLIPPKAGLQDEDVTVRVTFPVPVAPDVGTVIVNDMADPAGNAMTKIFEAAIEPIDDVPPEVTGHIAVISGGKLSILLGFDEPLREIEAVDPGNFSLSTGEDRQADLSEAALTYDAEGYVIRVELTAPERLQAGAAYSLSVRGISDISGNRLAEQLLEGALMADVQPAKAVSAQLNTEADESGKVVDLRFSAKLDRESAGSILAYRLSSGELPRRVRLLPGGDSVRLEFKESIMPDEVAIEVKGLSDSLGRPVARVGALRILPA